MMGSGGMIVMDESTCMVDVARYFVSFLEDESCGKCVPCREGLRRMRQVLDRITIGIGREEDLNLLDWMCRWISQGSLCGLGQTAPNPVLTTLTYFRDEYEAHIKSEKCPAGVCKELIYFSVESGKCVGCGACLKACPVEAITGELKKAHQIDIATCIKCGACREACNYDAVTVT
jgi:NADH-quinone oxidoreductase subunit F